MAQHRIIRVGVVGIGFARQVHVPCFRDDARCSVEMIAASDAVRAQSASEQLGIPRSTGDWRELIGDSAIDAVSIAVPPGLQPEIALAALKQGKAVLCEKPLGITRSDAEILAEASRAAAVANMVDFEFREVPMWQRARTLLSEGVIGPLSHAVVHWHVQTYANREKIDCWKTRKAGGGGALLNFVSHVFYYMEWLLGPIQRVSARLFRTAEDAGDADTSLAMTLELLSGALVSVSVHTNASPGFGHRVEVYGREGTILLENRTADYIGGFRLLLARAGTKQEPLWEQDAFGSGAGRDARVAAVRPVVGRFLDWIETGKPAKPDFEDGLRVQVLLDAARRSDESGLWVSVPGFFSEVDAKE